MWHAAILGIAGAGMLLAERQRPRRNDEPGPGPSRRRFLLRAAGLSLLQVAAAYAGATLLDPLIEPWRLFSAERLGVFGGVLYGYLGVTFIWYWWHRARHEVPFLWRALHQVHHSPKRLELATTYYKHPVESISNVVLGGITLTLVLGLTPAQSAGVALLCGLAEFFYHWNVRTPRWLGWLVQRPESHCIHHERGRHTSNYGDLPLWDWMFGTLDNPETDAHVECGFGPAESRLLSMLGFREVA